MVKTIKPEVQSSTKTSGITSGLDIGGILSVLAALAFGVLCILCGFNASV